MKHQSMSNTVAILIVVGALGLAFSGCGKKPTAGDNAGVPPAPPAGTDAAAAQATPPPPTPAPKTIAPPSMPTARPVTPAVIPQTASPDAVLSALTQALRKYSAEKQRVPSSLNEVVAAGYVQSLPQPPAGKKFAIDPKTVTVILQ